jgi:hypothetical protein
MIRMIRIVPSVILFLSAVSAIAAKTPAPAPASASAADEKKAPPTAIHELAMVKDVEEFWDRYRIPSKQKREFLRQEIPLKMFLTEKPVSTAASVVDSLNLGGQAAFEIGRHSEMVLVDFQKRTDLPYRPADTLPIFLEQHMVGPAVNGILTDAGVGSIDDLLTFVPVEDIQNSKVFPLMGPRDRRALVKAFNSERVLRNLYLELWPSPASAPAPAGASPVCADIPAFWNRYGLPQMLLPSVMREGQGIELRHILHTPLPAPLEKAFGGALTHSQRTQFEKGVISENLLRRLLAAGQGMGLDAVVEAETVDDLFAKRYNMDLPPKFFAALKREGCETTKRFLDADQKIVDLIIATLEKPIQRQKVEWVIEMERIAQKLRESNPAPRTAPAKVAPPAKAASSSSSGESKTPVTSDGLEPAVSIDEFWMRHTLLPSLLSPFRDSRIPLDDMVAESPIRQVSDLLAKLTLGQRASFTIAARIERLLKDFLKRYRPGSGDYRPSGDLANFMGQYGLSASLSGALLDAGVTSVEDLVSYASDDALSDGPEFDDIKKSERNDLRMALKFERVLRPLYMKSRTPRGSVAVDEMPPACRTFEEFWDRHGLMATDAARSLGHVSNPALGLTIAHFIQVPPLPEITNALHGSLTTSAEASIAKAAAWENQLRRILTIGQYPAVTKAIDAEPVVELFTRYRAGLPPEFIRALEHEGYVTTRLLLDAEPGIVAGVIRKHLPKPFMRLKAEWVLKTERDIDAYRNRTRL